MSAHTGKSHGKHRSFPRAGEEWAAVLLEVGEAKGPSRTEAGSSRRWERLVLEELGCFASTQRLEPVPASRLSCEELP